MGGQQLINKQICQNSHPAKSVEWAIAWGYAPIKDKKITEALDVLLTRSWL